MAKRVLGKVCIVTGGSSGIGLATVRQLAQEGGLVVLTSRSPDHVHSAVSQLLKEGLIVSGIVADAASDSQKLVDFTVGKYGKIDVLVCNAAAPFRFELALETKEAELRRMFDVNVFGTLLLCQAARPYLERSQAGAVVIVSSTAGYIGPSNFGAYSVTKTALFGLVKTLSLEFAKKKVRVNSVAPSLISTAFVGAEGENRKAILQYIPMGREGTPEEVTSVITFLVSDESRYITGENVPVNGGIGFRL